MNKRQFNGAIIACVFLISTFVVAQQDKRALTPLTNEDIVKMAKAGLPEDTIVLVIQKSPNRFDTSPGALIALKESGVTKKVLDALVKTQDSPASPEKIESSTSHELSPGLYSTEATQTYWGLSFRRTTEVSIKIKIDSVDRNGNVTGEFMHSTLGKGGKGGLAGKIERDSDFKADKLQLKGALVSKFGDTWQVNINATIGNKVLTKGQYQVQSRSVLLTGDFKKAELEEEK